MNGSFLLPLENLERMINHPILNIQRRILKSHFCLPPMYIHTHTHTEVLIYLGVGYSSPRETCTFPVATGWEELENKHLWRVWIRRRLILSSVQLRSQGNLEIMALSLGAFNAPAAVQKSIGLSKKPDCYVPAVAVQGNIDLAVKFRSHRHANFSEPSQHAKLQGFRLW